MTIAPLPAHRVYLQRTIQEPAFDQQARLLYAQSADGRTAVHRLELATGLHETITSEPMPAAGVTYGGGLFATAGGSLVMPARDGRLWCLDLASGQQRPITPAVDAVGGPVLSSCGRFAACAAEVDGAGEVLLASTDGRAFPLKLPGSLAFVGDVCLGPGGAYCAWQTWPATHMPWDRSELRIAWFARPLADCESLQQACPIQLVSVARGDAHLSFPLAHPDGKTLLFTSDESGWRAPWAMDLASRKCRQLASVAGEIGTPNWVLRLMPMALGQGGSRLYAINRRRSLCTLVAIELADASVTPLSSAFLCINALTCLDGGPGGQDQLAYTASAPATPTALYTRHVGPDAAASPEISRVSTSVGVWHARQYAEASTVQWEAEDGVEVWGVWTRAAVQGPAPLIVQIHGGPTSAAELNHDPTAQFFATRGYHYLAVNHRGSTQAGRAFQDMLKGRWGELDVQDARGGAQALVGRGEADAARVAIMGGSSGGYTTLLALAMQPDFWAAGISLYGVGDLYETMLGSHRFEKHYEQLLVGPLPESAERWRQRSPLTHAGRVKAPVLLFHGEQDKVVPVRQSVDFAKAVRSHGGVAEIVTYADEGHGFKREQTRRDMLERSVAFLEKYVRNLQGPARG